MPVTDLKVSVRPLMRWTALSALMSLAFPAALAGDNNEIALKCRFSSGLSAIYMFNRSDARVRRVDLLQSREGRVQASVAEYRFVFMERDSTYRIDVIIDRATGNARRVFGTRENMERTLEPRSEGNRLVYEAGQCDAQNAALR